ncbi:hypothetical protein [Streptomyces sp. NPDC051001]|uniref:hypothetical protein n=1 Tax=Streptomyces sp. NPDC051001 TaxID=3155795 RepID=UPI003412253C
MEERERGGDAFADRHGLRLQALGNCGAAGPDGLTITPALIDGVNILIAARHAVRATHGCLRLADRPSPCCAPMQLVGLGEIIGGRPTLRHALDA